MTNRIQTLRSSVAGSRPSGRSPGELYVNYPDEQFGVVDTTSAARDLLAVRFFSTLANYAIGDFVVQGGQLWQAIVAVAPGAFNPVQWNKAGGSVSIGDTPPSAPQAGALWWASGVSDGQLYVYFDDGDTKQWVAASNFTGGAAYLPLSGGVLTGPLVLAGNATANLNPVPLQQFNAAKMGVIDGSNAAAGQIGEFLLASANQPGNALAAGGQGAYACSLTLTAGDWDVIGNCSFYPTGSANISAIYTQITVGSVSVNGGAPDTTSFGQPSGLTPTTLTNCKRVSVSGGSVGVYLSAYANFTTGSLSAYGQLQARRAR